MSDSGEQGAPVSGENSNSSEQETPPTSEENSGSGQSAPNSEENSGSGEEAPTSENTPASSVGETQGKQYWDFEKVKAALSETISVCGEEKALVKPLKINFNRDASCSGEANEAEAPMPENLSEFVPNPKSWIVDPDQEGFHVQREAADPDEQETDSGEETKPGEQEVQSAAPIEIVATPADWKRAVSERAQVEEEEEENQKEFVPELIDNITVHQAELKERAVAHPSLLGGSSGNPALPPASDVPKPDLQPSESAAEKLELGKRKIDEKGKGKVEENQEDGGEEVSEEEEAASPESKKLKKSEDEGLAIGDPSLIARSNKNLVLPPAGAVTKPDSQPSESAAEKKRRIREKGKGKEGEEKQEDGGEEESEEDEDASPELKKPKNA